MAKTYQGDIPEHSFEKFIDIASAATNAGSTKAFVFNAPADIVVTEVSYTPTAADGAGGATSYRTLTLRDGGADASGTTAVATLALNATKASYVPVDFTVATANASVDEDDALYIYHVANTTAATVTALVGGQICIKYRLQ